MEHEIKLLTGWVYEKIFSLYLFIWEVSIIFNVMSILKSLKHIAHAKCLNKPSYPICLLNRKKIKVNALQYPGWVIYHIWPCQGLPLFMYYLTFCLRMFLEVPTKTFYSTYIYTHNWKFFNFFTKSSSVS